MKDKTRVRKKLLIEGFISLLIAITPLLFYFYKYLPIDSKSWSFIGINFSSNGFEDVSLAFYYYFNKLVPLLLLIIWFISCKNWWYHAILIPISMYSFQLYSVLTYDSGNLDENEIMYVIAVSMVVIPVVYFIRVKLVDKHVHGIDLKAMDTELQILKEKEELRKEREKLEKSQKTLSKNM
ncbi:hypothetical protein KIM67_14410 [Flagellimonas sp. 389]|uniref:hypothetical protein n=1 Tax=Flagellimonas sp. 389 TaxID=2835862 RepID=UPI001BD34E4D|nr:hypothetical protein [Flagellimonas sp. 389]MBS9463608.1 hypothetical protein [Flagellimonas sp. 389]